MNSCVIKNHLYWCGDDDYFSLILSRPGSIFFSSNVCRPFYPTVSCKTRGGVESLTKLSISSSIHSLLFFLSGNSDVHVADLLVCETFIFHNSDCNFGIDPCNDSCPFSNIIHSTTSTSGVLF